MLAPLTDSSTCSTETKLYTVTPPMSLRKRYDFLMQIEESDMLLPLTDSSAVEKHMFS